MRIGALEELEAALEAADVQDHALFASLLSDAISLLNLQLKDVAEQFAVSPASVTRWRQGRNAPHPALRRPIYRWLKRRTMLYRRELARREESAGLDELHGSA